MKRKMLNSRLSSKKALEILEFLCKKKFGVASRCNFGISQYCIWKGQDFAAIPNGSLLEVIVDVEFDDGKGFILAIQAQQPSGSCERMYFKKTIRLSWASILKKLLHHANKYGRMIVIGITTCIIRPGDTLEQILIEMDLEGCIKHQH